MTKQYDHYDIDVVIPSGEQNSNWVDLWANDRPPCSLVGVFTDSAFNGTALGLETRKDGEDTNAYTCAGTTSDISATVPTSGRKYVGFTNLSELVGVRHVRLVAGSAQSGGARSLTLRARRIV